MIDLLLFLALVLFYCWPIWMPLLGFWVVSRLYPSEKSALDRIEAEQKARLRAKRRQQLGDPH